MGQVYRAKCSSINRAWGGASKMRRGDLDREYFNIHFVLRNIGGENKLCKFRRDSKPPSKNKSY